MKKEMSHRRDAKMPGFDDSPGHFFALFASFAVKNLLTAKNAKSAKNKNRDSSRIFFRWPLSYSAVQSHFVFGIAESAP
jgi:hypothetical protein